MITNGTMKVQYFDDAAMQDMRLLDETAGSDNDGKHSNTVYL